MRFLLRFFIGFLALTGAVALSTSLLQIQFGHSDYWSYHGVLFLVFITFFPRLTLLLSSISSGGLLWWLSWIFAPRFLVAVLATINYWHQNSILVFVAWLIAFWGESSEKYVIVRRSSWGDDREYESAKWVKAETKKMKRRS